MESSPLMMLDFYHFIPQLIHVSSENYLYFIKMVLSFILRYNNSEIIHFEGHLDFSVVFKHVFTYLTDLIT